MIRPNFIKTTFLVSFSLLFLLLCSCDDDGKQSKEWSFIVTDRIQSNPVIDKDVIYFGCNDSIFYAVNAISGKELWKKKTNQKIRSQAVINKSTVFFSSGNNLFALNKSTGQEIWAYHSLDTTGSDNFDPWDYHTSSPIIHDSKVFVGFGNGMLLGFDQETGGEKFRFRSINSSAIRSTPFIKDKVIYFGDWNGRLYAVAIKNADTLWTHRTYENQPYPTFGQINTKLIIHDSILIFGARNPELQVVDIYSGNKIWSYVAEDGGWISGDPILSGDTLFIAGSDNHKLIAFNVYSGEIFWQYEFLFNNFSQPVIKDDFIFFTTGDAYAFAEKNYGNGYLYALNKKDGTIKNMTHFDGSQFTSPILVNDRIVVGGDNKKLRAIDYQAFISATTLFKENGRGPVDKMEAVNDTITNTVLFSFSMNYAAPLTIEVRDFDGEKLAILFEGDRPSGQYELAWDCKNEVGDLVPDGYYIIETRSSIFIKNQIVGFENR